MDGSKVFVVVVVLVQLFTQVLDLSLSLPNSQ